MNIFYGSAPEDDISPSVDNSNGTVSTLSSEITKNVSTPDQGVRVVFSRATDIVFQGPLVIAIK